MSHAVVQSTRQPGEWVAGGSGYRMLYSRAIHAEACLPGGAFVAALHEELRGLAAVDSHESLQDCLQAAQKWTAAEAQRYTAVFASAGDAETAGVLVRRAVLGCAPLGLLSGAWLQWLSGPGTAEDPVALRTLALYADDVGVGLPRASRGSGYLALLHRLQLAGHAVPPGRITLHPRLGDAAFRLPALLLAMSRRPEDFRAELLGADVCLRTLGLLPALTAVRRVRPDVADWSALDLAAPPRAGAQPALAASVGIVDGLLAAGADDREVLLGAAAALGALRAWSADLLEELAAARDPGFEMAELLRARSRQAAAYHRGFRLQGRPLSEWMRVCAADPGPLLAALATSPLVSPGHPERSVLVTGLVSDGSPMFRAFDVDDLAVIRRWIRALPRSLAAPESPPLAAAEGTGAGPAAAALAAADATGGAAGGIRPRNLREAYHLLLRRAETPAVREFALEYVHAWTARSRYGLDSAAGQLPPAWQPHGLRPWLAEQHDRHHREFQDEAAAALPSREALVESTVQLAPLILIDGGWLHGFTDYEWAASEIGHLLFDTYWDELGNGELALNHPLIYRQVLAEMGVRLPPTASTEFAGWSGFRDSSFELPVYWLSIGRFPTTFLPELLGLNLAMELSGVGGSYRRARQALQEHGFSTRFVDIHDTIDNVVSGHSAWAADAVDTFLASLGAAPGSAVAAEMWHRVRVGYRSLNPPTGFRARHAGRRVHAGVAR